MGPLHWLFSQWNTDVYVCTVEQLVNGDVCVYVLSKQ